MVVEGVRCGGGSGGCGCGVGVWVVVEGVGGLTNEVKKGRQNALRQSLRSLVGISSA